MAYTKPGDVVVDLCAGSCPLGIACIGSNRVYIGVEKDSACYWEVYTTPIPTHPN